MTNDDMRRVWSDNAAGWVRQEAVFDALFEPVTAAIVEELGVVEAGSRLLDVGCGTGTLMAEAEALGAAPVGIDISETMVEAARVRVPGAEVLAADAQTADLLAAAPGAPFAHVISRFGVMFFADPAAAFANLRRASAPGARLTFACWRERDENPMFSLGFDALERRLDPPEPSEPGAPGPMAFADPDRLRSHLGSAEWGSVAIAPLDFVCDYSRLGGDGIEERIGTILASTGGRTARARLLADLGPAGWEEVLDQVRADLRSRLVDGAVRFPGACWLVTAQDPRPGPAS